MHRTLDSNRVALVTGASSGFGALTAQRLCSLGFLVFGTSRSPQPDRDGIVWLRLDVDDDESVRDCARSLLARAGRIDVLVNNAGRASVGACEETSADEARALFETNLFGVMRVVSAFLPSMRAQESGVIVNLGSVSGYVGTPFHGVYAASKHALAGYSEALSLEVAEFGIRVSLIEPAAHRTGIQMTQPIQPLAVYHASRTRVEAIIRKQIDDGPDPSLVVDAVVCAATQASGRLRYRVGSKAKLASLGRRILSDRLMGQLLRREFQLGAGRLAVAAADTPLPPASSPG